MFFWWKTNLPALFPRISRFLQKGTDKEKIVSLLNNAGFNSSTKEIYEHTYENIGTKGSYVHQILVDQYAKGEIAPFAKLGKLITVKDYYRSDYNYDFCMHCAKKIAKQIRNALKVELYMKEKKINSKGLLIRNILKTTGTFSLGLASITSAIIAVLEYLNW